MQPDAAVLLWDVREASIRIGVFIRGLREADYLGDELRRSCSGRCWRPRGGSCCAGRWVTRPPAAWTRDSTTMPTRCSIMHFLGAIPVVHKSSVAARRDTAARGSRIALSFPDRAADP